MAAWLDVPNRIIAKPAPFSITPPALSIYMDDSIAGSINKLNHKTATLWSAECAEHVLPLFEKEYTKDQRPRKAIEAARAWAHGDIRVGEARIAALTSHAAAREATDDAAKAAARAAGHAAGTAHMIGHAVHAAAYSLQAVGFVKGEAAIAKERDWQYRRLQILRKS